MEDQKLSVYLCGAHCAGKTTLQNSLQAHWKFSKLGFKSQEELARPVMKEDDLTQEKMRNKKILFEFEKKISIIQCRAEDEEIKENGGRYTRFLWDRGVIDAFGYTKALVGDEETDKLKEIPEVKKMLEKWRRGEDCLIFLLKPQAKFIEDDGIRRISDYDELLKIYNEMTFVLKSLEINFSEITCLDLNKRVEQVVHAVSEKWNL